jgi:hypothetical protein
MLSWLVACRLAPNANTNSAKLNRVSLDYTNNKHNSKTKVLAPLGSGNLQAVMLVSSTVLLFSSALD